MDWGLDRIINFLFFTGNSVPPSNDYYSCCFRDKIVSNLTMNLSSILLKHFNKYYLIRTRIDCPRFTYRMGMDVGSDWRLADSDWVL